MCETPLGRACILPPYLLERIAENGDAQQRVRALRSLSVDTSIRSARLQNALLRGGLTVRRVDVLAIGARDAPQRTVSDAGGSETLPGAVRRNEGDTPSGDPAVDEAYGGLGAAWTLYADAFDRNSVDDAGLPLLATVHYGHDYDNAFWDGRRLVFGDGDGQLFLRFTRSLEVIGHELAHGVVEDEAGLLYVDEPGALNESLADVFGSLVKQHARGQTAGEADWLIGAELLGPDVRGVALRSMIAPGSAYDDPILRRDPQVAHMRDYVRTTSDNGGVHVNSGIANRAFALAAVRIGGFAWERAGRIWYDALRDPSVTPTTRFAGFARATVRAAQHAFPGDVQTVRDAWAEVGVAV